MFCPSRRSKANRYFSQGLRVNDVEGNLLFLIMPSVPQEIVQGFLDKLELIYPGSLQETDSERLGPNHKFDVIHYNWWFRYAPRVSLFLLFIT